MKLWAKFTDLEPARQGPALVMFLVGKALDTILELDNKDILHNNGVTTIINSLYKKDELKKFSLKKFEDFERFKKVSTDHLKPKCNNLQQNLINHTTN